MVYDVFGFSTLTLCKMCFIQSCPNRTSKIDPWWHTTLTAYQMVHNGRLVSLSQHSLLVLCPVSEELFHMGLHEEFVICCPIFRWMPQLSVRWLKLNNGCPKFNAGCTILTYRTPLFTAGEWRRLCFHVRLFVFPYVCFLATWWKTAE